MTPNGEIYIANVHLNDFGIARPGEKAFFIHEMVHVYQYQLNILNPVDEAIKETFRHGFNYEKSYYYTLDASKDLLDYGIEQQDQIIENYYRIRVLGIQPKGSYLKNSISDVIKKSLFTKILNKFLTNPLYAKHDIVCKPKFRGKSRELNCTRVLAQ